MTFESLTLTTKNVFLITSTVIIVVPHIESSISLLCKSLFVARNTKLRVVTESSNNVGTLAVILPTNPWRNFNPVCKIDRAHQIPQRDVYLGYPESWTESMLDKRDLRNKEQNLMANQGTASTSELIAIVCLQASVQSKWWILDEMNFRIVKKLKNFRDLEFDWAWRILQENEFG